MSDELESRIHIGDAPFSVAARVAMQLGRESISNSMIAITELVKNAYDADATQVSIRFHGLNTADALLIISDDGCGMSEEALRNQWMVVGTAGKKLVPRSPSKNRTLTGEKGLGRLGLDRLCKIACVKTFVQDQDYGLELVVDWSKYEGPERRLEEVNHPIYRIGKTLVDPVSGLPIAVSSGTVIVLHGLKDEWDESALAALRDELTLLVSPFGTGDDFEIRLDSGMNLGEVDGVVGAAEMLVAAEWQLTAAIMEDGSIAYRMFSSHHDKTYELPDTTWANRFKGRSHRFPRCGPLRFEMFFYPRKLVELEDIRFSVRQIKNFLELQQGIRIYRDGFRVKPYGEPTGEGDWLTLAYRRQRSPGGVTQHGWRVGYNQVVGAVFIGREQNPELVDQTNREGLVEGAAFNDLKMFALDAIDFFERSRTQFAHDFETDDLETARRRAEEKASTSLDVAKSLQDTTRTVKGFLERAQQTGDTASLTDAGSLLDDATAKVAEVVAETHEAQRLLAEISRDQEQEFQRQKDTLANLASLGILAAGFGHETLASANLLLVNAKQLDRNLRQGLFMVFPDVQGAVEHNLSLLVKEASSIKDFAEFTLKNIQRDKRERKAVFLDQVVRNVFEQFAGSFDKKHIEIELDLPEESIHPILAFEIDWESILLNLISNAVWAIDQREHDGRRIRVVLREMENTIELRFADSGCGIASGTEHDIFLPTFSTKRGPDGRVFGTGMGLAIVKSFIGEHTGSTITVTPNSDLGGAEFAVRVPIPELASRGNKKKR